MSKKQIILSFCSKKYLRRYATNRPSDGELCIFSRKCKGHWNFLLPLPLHHDFFSFIACSGVGLRSAECQNGKIRGLRLFDQLSDLIRSGDIFRHSLTFIRYRVTLKMCEN